MSLETPEKIRSLQRKLYCKAKAEPAFRFYLLYDKIHREDILRHAYALARANAGAPGVDGEELRGDCGGGQGSMAGGAATRNLVTKTYRACTGATGDDPEAGRRRTSARHPDNPGSGGSDRRQAGVEPIFEADLEDSVYGYRPGRGGTDPVKEVHRLLGRGYTDVVDADLSKYFDTIPHSELLKSVARRIVDRHVLG